MNENLKIVIGVYKLLIRFYPKKFRNEFEEQMLLDFTDMASDASTAGRRSLFIFCLKELADYPFNLLQIHWKENRVLKLLRSQPVMYAVWVALGYGIVSFLATLISEVVFRMLEGSSDSVIGYLQVFYFDLFHTEHGLELIALIPSIISLLLIGLLLGVAFAILLAERAEYHRFIIAGMLGWYLHESVPNVLSQSVNLVFFLGTKHSDYLSYALSALSSAFIGLMFVAAKSKTNWLLRFLAVGAIGYPGIAYLYLQLLFKFSVIESPWMFIALMTLVLVFIGSLIMVVLKSVDSWKGIGMVLAAMVVFQILPYLLRYIPMKWLSFPELPYTFYYDDPVYWQFILKLAIQQGIYGIPLGLILGLVFGLLNRKASQRTLT